MLTPSAENDLWYCLRNKLWNEFLSQQSNFKSWISSLSDLTLWGCRCTLVDIHTLHKDEMMTAGREALGELKKEHPNMNITLDPESILGDTPGKCVFHEVMRVLDYILHMKWYEWREFISCISRWLRAKLKWLQCISNGVALSHRYDIVTEVNHCKNIAFIYNVPKPRRIFLLRIGPLLLTWINFNPSMDK